MTAAVSVSGLPFAASGLGVAGAVAAGLLSFLRDRFDLFNGSAE